MDNTEKRKCMICNKATSEWVTNPKYPEKQICLECLNGFIFNLNTLDRELKPIIDALEDWFEKLGRELEKRQAQSEKRKKQK